MTPRSTNSALTSAVVGGDKASGPSLGGSGDADAQLWAKVEPRVLKQPGGKKSLKYVVKTFSTQLVEVKDDDYESGFYKTEQPRDPSELPYALVEASPSLDVWSFGLFTSSSPVLRSSRRIATMISTAPKRCMSWRRGASLRSSRSSRALPT